MKKYLVILFIGVLTACAGNDTSTYMGYTESGPINGFSRENIQLRQLDLINAIRAESGAAPVQLSAQLTAAALTHSRDIEAQQRAWNFGSDRSTPQTRAQRAGFAGIVTGENVSETYRGEVQVMQNWLNSSMSRSVITDPTATHVGIAYYMESSGKVWWTQSFGAINARQTSDVYTPTVDITSLTVQ